ncbi:antitoxin of toxin-antitoxin stability system [Sphingobium sp. LB126]|uniref:antitoxin of toxin-antitoxin stability system n=1 Tax=Sphingobium sp. LB126 TaxID=1983755 RepID=UPI000C2031E9|nr:antitoxin of toxin-antitoxin stability system [Sphingobium sp. LB126]PJG47232.1 antitoxin of toxin-antitoxin stability system [Sphingobium sp. LB126]
MPQVIETLVYRLDELDESAREHARDWYRTMPLDSDWYESLFEHFEDICNILGVSLATQSVRLMGGGSREQSKIYFSGFCSQGDGASFVGQYRYARGAAQTIRAHAPNTSELHAIADRLQDAQRRNFYQLGASIEHAGCYYHEYSMRIDVRRDSQTGQDLSLADEELVIDALRDLARWIYRTLETEFDFLMAGHQVDEAIRANDFTFTERGRRFG